MADKTLSENLTILLAILIIFRFIMYKMYPDKSLTFVHWDISHSSELRYFCLLLAAVLFYILVWKGKIRIDHFGAAMFITALLYTGTLLTVPIDLENTIDGYVLKSKKEKSIGLDELIWVCISGKILMDLKNKM